MTGDDIDEVVHNTIIEGGAYPTPLDFMHFPKSVAVTANECISHGIPNNRIITNRDYINIDVSCYLQQMHGDTSAMLIIGDAHPLVQTLVSSNTTLIS